MVMYIVIRLYLSSWHCTIVARCLVVYWEYLAHYSELFRFNLYSTVGIIGSYSLLSLLISLMLIPIGLRSFMMWWQSIQKVYFNIRVIVTNKAWAGVNIPFVFINTAIRSWMDFRWLKFFSPCSLPLFILLVWNNLIINFNNSSFNNPKVN